MTWRDQTSFPLDVYPNAIQRFVTETAASVCVHPDMLASAFPAVAGALIGRSRVVAAKDDGWYEGPRIFVAVVADPGSRKSPAVARLIDPLRRIENRLDDEDALALAAWEALPAKEKKNGPPPVRRLIVTDITIETLAERLRSHSRGLLAHRNELSGWLKAHGKYTGGKGDERQQWLDLWDGQTLRVDRIQRGSFVVRHPHVCLLGTIQPDLVSTLASKDGNDGMLDRFLFAAPPHIKPEYDTPLIDAGVREAYAELCEGLYELRSAHLPRGAEPVILEMDQGGRGVARAGFVDHYEQLERLRQERSPLVGHWAKVDAYVHRIAVILAEVWHVCEEQPEVIGAETMVQAWAVVDYFKGQAAAILGPGGAMEPKAYERAGPALEKLTLRWIIERGTTSLRLIRKDGPLYRVTLKEAKEVLEALESECSIIIEKKGRSWHITGLPN